MFRRIRLRDEIVMHIKLTSETTDVIFKLTFPWR